MQDGIKTNIKACDGRGKKAQLLNDKQADKAHYYSLKIICPKAIRVVSKEGNMKHGIIKF